MKCINNRAIIYRLREGVSARQMAKEGLASRDKIQEIQKVCQQKGWLEADTVLPDDAQLAVIFNSKKVLKTESKSEPHREFIKQAVGQGIKATVIHQRLVEQYGFQGAYNSVQRLVKQIKQSELSELTVPLQFAPGEAAQVDFGKGPRLYDRRIEQEIDTWFFVMTLCWSRHQYAELITHQDIETWLRCHQQAWQWFGGVPAKVIVDNAKCAIIKACYFDPQVQRSYEDFAQAYGFIISACPPREPQKKGRVESGVKYIKTNFLPLRHLTDLQQANDALKKWMMTTAGQRVHGSTFEQPLKQFEQERTTLKALPNPLPEIAVWQKVTLYRDCHVRYQSCLYSAPFYLYHEKCLWLKATPTTITIYHEHERVAHHSRVFKKGACQTCQEHLPPKARYYLKRNPEWCLARSAKIGDGCAKVIDELIHDTARDLLRQAQGILALEKHYGAEALEKACQQAIVHHTLNYKTIKAILQRGIEERVVTASKVDIVTRPIYQGGARFQREAHEFKH